ncbi:hypothetical protein ECEC1848_1874, partial [Escherichia coli EC1848]
CPAGDKCSQIYG